MDAVDFNRQLDERLMREGTVDAQLFVDLHDAYAYDAASSVGWLEAKVAVLHRRLVAGGRLQLFESDCDEPVAAETVQDFEAWVRRHFPIARLPK
jgi:hypothetical protein